MYFGWAKWETGQSRVWQAKSGATLQKSISGFMGRWATGPPFTSAHSLKSCNGRGKCAPIPKMPTCPQSPLFLRICRERDIPISHIIWIIWQNQHISPYSAQTWQFPFCCAFAITHAEPAGIAQHSSSSSGRISPDDFCPERFRQDYVFSHSVRFPAKADTVNASVNTSVHILKATHAMLFNEKTHG